MRAGVTYFIPRKAGRISMSLPGREAFDVATIPFSQKCQLIDISSSGLQTKLFKILLYMFDPHV